jgi:hypothetical protein
MFKNGVSPFRSFPDNFTLKSTGMVKTGLPTQILKNHFNPLKVYKCPEHFSKNPQICFFRRKIR